MPGIKNQTQQRRPRNNDNDDLLDDIYMNPRVPLNGSSPSIDDPNKKKSKRALVDKLYESNSNLRNSSAKKDGSNPSKVVVVDEADKNSQKVKDYIVEQNHHQNANQQPYQVIPPNNYNYYPQPNQYMGPPAAVDPNAPPA